MDNLSAKRKRNVKLLLKIAGVILVSIALIWGIDFVNLSLDARGNGKQKVINISTYSGEIEGINAAYEIFNRSNELAGYKVDITTKGYGSDIRMEAVFNASVNELEEIFIVEQGETEELGARITEDEFLNNFKGKELTLVLNGFPEVPKKDSEDAPLGQLKDGTYTAEESGFDVKGYKGSVTIKVAEGKITALNWDADDKEGNKKSQLSMDGLYKMTEDGPRWDEQAKELADYVIEHQSMNGLTTDDAGKTDAITSVSIDISAFKTLVGEALKQASKEPVKLADGSYTVEEKEFNSSGYKHMLTMEVGDGKIMSLKWDGVDQEGNKKRKLSMEGKYVMTEDGARWDEQVDALASYIIKNQSYEGLSIDDAGETDTIASVSIDINPFINLLKQGIAEASGQTEQQAEKLSANESESVSETNGVDAVSGATVSSKAVVRGVNNSYTFLKEFVLKQE